MRYHRLIFPVAIIALMTAGTVRGQQIVESVLGMSSGEQLGQACAGIGDIDGDGVPDFVLGAPGNSNGLGVVYAYSGADRSLLYSRAGSWPKGELGFSVGAVGDVDLDGVPDFAAGAPFAKTNLNEDGVVQVYSGAGGFVVHTVIGEIASQLFGYSVAGIDDISGDGYDDFVVGAEGFGNLARVFSGKDAQIFTNLNTFIPGSLFGHAVASGDANGDGVHDILVTAALEQVSSTQVGRAYLYSGSSFGLLRSFNPPGGTGTIGFSAAFLGDLDGDGGDDIALGGGLTSGALYVFSGKTGQSLFNKTQAAAPGTNFGFSVAAAGDINGDGVSDVITGAPIAQLGTFLPGMIIGFSGQDGAELFRFGSPLTYTDNFGYAVSRLGDTNGDGIAEQLVGVPTSNTPSGSDYSYGGAGRAHVLSPVDIPIIPVDFVTGDKVIGEIGTDAEGTHLLQFEGLAGMILKIKVTTVGSSLSPRLTLEDGEGQAIDAWVVPAGANKAKRTYVLQSAGTFQIRVTGEGGTTGEYVLKTGRVLPGFAADAKKTWKGQVEYSQPFDAFAGSTAFIKVKPKSELFPYDISLIGPDDAPVDLTALSEVSSKGVTKIKEIAFPQTGRYTLRLSGVEQTSHKFSLKLDLTHHKGKSVITVD